MEVVLFLGLIIMALALCRIGFELKNINKNLIYYKKQKKCWYDLIKQWLDVIEDFEKKIKVFEEKNK